MAKLLFYYVLLLGLSFASKLLGDDNIVMVQDGCDHLDMSEIRRLTEFELSQSNEMEPYRITLVCQGDSLRILVYYQPDKSPMERSVKLNDTKLKERIVSLTATQLVTTHLRVEAEKRLVESTTNVANVEVEKPVPPPPFVPVSPPEEEVVDQVVISVGGGVKPHGEFFLPLGYGVIRSDFWFSDRWGMMSALSFEGGMAKRNLGNVTAMSGLVGLGAVCRLFGMNHIRLEVMGIASAGYTYLKGEPRQNGTGYQLSGIAGEFIIGFSGIVEAKNVVIALDLLGGYTFDNPIGLITSDDSKTLDKSVTLGGFWLGGGLRIGAKKS